MSDVTTSPSPIQKDSTTSFANDPLLPLLQPKPLHKMSQDEIREEVNKLRQLRTSPQSLGKSLREGAAKKKVKEESEVTTRKESLDDVLGDLSL